MGGASAFGCAAFGLGSLIVGVGLVVWLGAMTMSSTDGGSSRKRGGGDTDITTDVSTLTSSLEDLTSGGAPVEGMEPVGAALAVPADLPADGTTTATGTDLAPGPIELTWCLAVPDSRFEAARCDDATTATATVGDDGRLSLEVPIHRVITVDGTAYDCGARAGACALFGHRPDALLDTGIAAPLAFASGLPPVDAAAPPGG